MAKCLNVLRGTHVFAHEANVSTRLYFVADKTKQLRLFDDGKRSLEFAAWN